MRFDYNSYESNGYWAVNITIPDMEFINELISYYQSRIEKEILSSDTSEELRQFLRNDLHIATSKEEVRAIFRNARVRHDPHCVVIAFNSSLTQREYSELQVSNVQYLKWTKNVWKRITKEGKQEILKFLKKNGCCILSFIIKVIWHIASSNGWGM